MAEREAQIAAASPSFTPPAGLITQLTGVEGVHLAAPEDAPSDLAVAAARKLLAETGADPEDIDLVVFAAGSQDVTEPATAHIIAAKLGLSCPVFDVKNACNSVLNAIELTQALVAGGHYASVLIVCGERGSDMTRLRVPDPAAFARAFPGYGFSDVGAALLFTAVEERPGAPGVLGCRFLADSSLWGATLVPAGGSAAIREPSEETRYVRMDGSAMRDGIRVLVPRLTGLLDDLGLRFGEFAFVGVHQVAVADVRTLVGAGMGITKEQMVVTVARHGNVASASLPLQLVQARERGLAGPGDLVALLGLAAGASVGLAVLRL
ncbi:3-oxoacyl-[acyl-carrier-protein] synthase III C-terminal domain-containing protein [Kitasatospora sp. NPDC096077]|uniref:3-oxoacyl-ACP synthase III family protein n=1 Tax=Kitasatospora sp. NPDC096077 TaxID=3155544 RepID=UPI003324C352